MKNEATGSKNIVGMKTFSLENEARIDFNEWNQKMCCRNLTFLSESDSNEFCRFWVLRVTTLLLALVTQFFGNYLPVVNLFQTKSYYRDRVREDIIYELLSEERNWFACGHLW